MVLSAFSTVSIFFLSLSSEPELISPPTVREPPFNPGLNVNAVAKVLILGVLLPTPLTNIG
jgi:hypothetical protein